MHELSIAQNILDIVREHVPEARRSEVRAVTIRLGELAGVVADSLEFCFSAIVSDTLLSQAVLKIDRIPIRMHCSTCGKISTIEGLAFLCQACAGQNIQVISGTELQVSEIELADAPREAV
jgi:hydrogenase nickel incorporation protein HypA/HybF